MSKETRQGPEQEAVYQEIGRVVDAMLTRELDLAHAQPDLLYFQGSYLAVKHCNLGLRWQAFTDTALKTFRIGVPSRNMECDINSKLPWWWQGRWWMSKLSINEEEYEVEVATKTGGDSFDVRNFTAGLDLTGIRDSLQKALSQNRYYVDPGASRFLTEGELKGMQTMKQQLSILQAEHMVITTAFGYRPVHMSVGKIPAEVNWIDPAEQFITFTPLGGKTHLQMPLSVYDKNTTSLRGTTVAEWILGEDSYLAGFTSPVKLLDAYARGTVFDAKGLYE